MTRWYARVRWIFWSSWMCTAFWSLSQWRAPTPAGAVEVTSAGPAFLWQTAPIDSSLALLSVLLERMPFDNAELPEPEVEAEQAAVGVMRPQTDTGNLVLRGIALGAKPQAIIDGLPGIEYSRVMHVGDTVGDVSLLAVGGDSAVVVIRGRHTTVFLKRSDAVTR